MTHHEKKKEKKEEVEAKVEPIKLGDKRGGKKKSLLDTASKLSCTYRSFFSKYASKFLTSQAAPGVPDAV